MLKTHKQKRYSQCGALKLACVITTVAKKLPAEWEASAYWFKGQTECTARAVIDQVIPE